MHLILQATFFSLSLVVTSEMPRQHVNSLQELQEPILWWKPKVESVFDNILQALQNKKT